MSGPTYEVVIPRAMVLVPNGEVVSDQVTMFTRSQPASNTGVSPAKVTVISEDGTSCQAWKAALSSVVASALLTGSVPSPSELLLTTPRSLSIHGSGKAVAVHSLWLITVPPPVRTSMLSPA